MRYRLSTVSLYIKINIFQNKIQKRQPHISMQPSSRNPNLNLTDSHPRVRQDVDIN